MSETTALVSCRIAPYRIASSRMVSYRIVCYRINISHRMHVIISLVSYNVVSYYNVWYHIISYHIASYQIMPCHVLSYHVISCDIVIISHHIISYRTTAGAATEDVGDHRARRRVCRWPGCGRVERHGRPRQDMDRGQQIRLHHGGGHARQGTLAACLHGYMVTCLHASARETKRNETK